MSAAAVAAALLLSLVLPRAFVASVTIVPETGQTSPLPAGLTTLAGQLGVSIGSQGSRGADFYGELLRTRALLAEVATARFVWGSAVDSQPLVVVLGKGGRSSADSLSRSVKALRDQITIVVDKQMGTIKISVEMPTGDLAAAVAGRLVEYLNDFNRQSRQSQARERRKFLEGRVAETESELREGESALRLFYERNRRFEESPKLRFDEQKLSRQVTFLTTLYGTLRQQLEIARIDEINDVPVITVLDPPVVPQEPAKPRHLLMALMAMVLSLGSSVIVVLGLELYPLKR